MAAHYYSVLANWDTVGSALIKVSPVDNAGRLSVCFVDYRTAVPLVGTAVFLLVTGALASRVREVQKGGKLGL